MSDQMRFYPKIRFQYVYVDGKWCLDKTSGFPSVPKLRGESYFEDEVPTHISAPDEMAGGILDEPLNQELNEVEWIRGRWYGPVEIDNYGPMTQDEERIKSQLENYDTISLESWNYQFGTSYNSWDEVRQNEV